MKGMDLMFNKFLIKGSIKRELKPEIVYSSNILNRFRNVTFRDIELLTLTEFNQFKKEVDESSVSST